MGCRHRREDVDCGSPELNDYLRHTTGQRIDKGLSRTEMLVGLAYIPKGDDKAAVCLNRDTIRPHHLAESSFTMPYPVRRTDSMPTRAR